MLNKCGNCAENHNTADCHQPKKMRCVSCNTEDHASWSRTCPTFLRKIEDYNRRNPENMLPYYPTSDPWTWSSGDTHAPQTSANFNAYTIKKANSLSKQRSTTPKEPTGTNTSVGPTINARPTPFNRMTDIPGWNIGLDTPENNGWWDDVPNNSNEAGSSTTRPTNFFSNATHNPTPTLSPNA